MKQILQDLKSGRTSVEDVPAPSAAAGMIAVTSVCSLISAGTERMLVDFGKSNLLQKARQQPDKVKQVLEKAKTDGILPTMHAVRSKLDAPLPLGYCNVGVVQEVGAAVTGYKVGDRVVSNGKHAEVVVVPKNLSARIPDNVDDETAVFTVIAAIALQGIRLINPTLGETVAVSGLGLIGLVAVQLLKGCGCRVIGMDYDATKLALAASFGAETVDLSKGEDPVAAAHQFSRGRGVDAVLITASTSSNEPIHQAALMSRQRGRIVLVGVVGTDISRADFYEKELTFQVSCSYGPGRYDPEYEEKGHDYPIGFVRWTEQRNFEAILDMMADGRLDMKPLISHRFPLESAGEAYEVISEGDPLGVLLEYPRPSTENRSQKSIVLNSSSRNANRRACIGFIGAGNYASGILVPAFSKAGARLKTIASSTGVSSVHVGKKYGVEVATTDVESIFEDTDINAIAITTRHNSHARFVIEGLERGKHVFVEKPLALNKGELDQIISTCEKLAENRPYLMVGFNRRYSPYVRKIRSAVCEKNQPISVVMTVNAGEIPSSHWTQDPHVGGGRIIGEACHFIDLIRHIVGSSIVNINTVAMDSQSLDSVIINLRFENGSIGAVNYLANGSKSFPKERLEVFAGGSILQLNNFRSLTGYGWPGFQNQSTWRQNKGQIECASEFVRAVENSDDSQLIPADELFEVMDACFTVMEQISQA
jgi:predicted dehydrogenase/threonine dehydrogenase-like Zn-dependent dehydrogenase